jgi:Spy/CpxP family protein refolding chaperone
MTLLGSGARARLLAAAVLVTTLVAGGLAGAAIERMRAQDSGARPFPREPRGGGRGDSQAEFWRRSDYGKLGLSEEQIQRMNVVLERQREQLDAFWRTARPQMDSVVTQTRAEIRAILTPEQRTELDRIRAERRERFRREGRDGRPGRNGPGGDSTHEHQGRGKP